MVPGHRVRDSPWSALCLDGRVVADAAFGRYVREAADFAGGRRIDRVD